MLVDAGGMCLALGAQGCSRGATEVCTTLNEQLLRTFFLVNIWVKTEEGGTYAVKSSGSLLAASSAAFAALILLWGVLRSLVGCEQCKWGCMHFGFFVLPCFIAFIVPPSSPAPSLVCVFFTFLVFGLVVVSSVFDGPCLCTFEAGGGDAGVVLTTGAFLAWVFGGIVWE